MTPPTIGRNTMRRKWTLPASWAAQSQARAQERSQERIQERTQEKSRAGDAADATAPAPPQKAVSHYVAKFIFYLIISSIVGLLVRSSFPIALAIFLFFADGEFVEWVLRRDRHTDSFRTRSAAIS